MDFRRNAEDLGWRETLVLTLLPLGISGAGLWWAVLLQKAEFVAYRSGTPRFILSIVAGAIGLMTWSLTVTILLAKFWKRMNWRAIKGSVSANLFALAFMFFTIPPFIATLALFDAYFEELELDALAAQGIPGRFSILYSKEVRGRHPHYRFSFFVPDKWGNRRELSITRGMDDWMNLGDTATIMYLPENPTIFREASPE